MKCIYCKTKVALFNWLLFFGRCFPCDYKIEERGRKDRIKRYEKQEKDSDKYWKKQKGKEYNQNDF